MSKFDQEHDNLESHIGGFPDTGNGYFSNHLTYSDWLHLQSNQRIQLNFLETLIPIVLLISISSINYPYIAIILIVVLILGRLIYSIGYISSSQKFKTFGSIIFDLVFIISSVLAVLSIYRWDMTSIYVYPFNASDYERVY